MKGAGINPAIDHIITILPLFSLRRGKNSCIIDIVPNRFTSSTYLNLSSGIHSTGHPKPTHALFMIACSGILLLIMSFFAFKISLVSVMSILMGLISHLIFSSFSLSISFLYHAKMVHPLLAKSWTKCFHIPDVAPVIIIDFLSVIFEYDDFIF